MEELNNMRKSISASIEAYSKAIAVSSQIAGDDAEKIKEVEDLHIFVVENVDKLRDHIMEFTKGGIDQIHLAQYQFLREGADRSSGMSEAQRGQVSGAGTATEADIASQASSKRYGYMAEKFIQGVAGEIFKKEAWYAVHDDRFRLRMNEGIEGLFFDPETGEPVEEAIMTGGGDTSIWDDLDLSVEPITMRYTSETLEMMRQQEEDQFMLTVAPLLPQIALYTDIEGWLRDKGDKLNNPNLPKRFNVEAARMIGAAMLQMQGQPGTGQGQTQPEPKLSQDIPSRLVNPGFSQKASRGGGSDAQKTLSATTGNRSQVKQAS
jgi:hypothetical protein